MKPDPTKTLAADAIIRNRRKALLTILGGSLGLAAALRAAAQSASPGGIHQLAGDVRINGQTARRDMQVRAGDTVQTGTAALAVFSVGQDAFLLRANTGVAFAGQDVALDTVRLLAGRLLSVFGKGAPRSLMTSTATIGIRGTGAYMEAERLRTYFCLCYGTADIATSRGDARDSYTTAHHESPRYIYNDGRQRPIVMANVANHTDDELIMLEALVGRKPPDTFMASPYRY
jgi:hypothetical protein